ncbi:MAG TPA: DUF481 domain-containing protein [Polyangia bacterium]
MTTPPIFVRRCLFVLGLPFVVLATAGAAHAQNAPVPAFDFAKQPPPEKPAVEWKVQAKGGLLVTSGNSETGSGTLSLDGSRQQGRNKLSLNGRVAYGRSRLLVPIPDATDTATIGYRRESRTTTNEWLTRGRYDRFITDNNSAYVVGQIASDKIAGKQLMGGGQVGYSRQLLKNAQHTLVAEAGYDLSFESYVPVPDKTLDSVTIHSARLFVGELFTLTKETGFSGSVEALFNLNKEEAYDARDITGNTKGVGAFKDTRVIGKLGLTTTLHKSLSLGIGFTLKYDQNPAPIPLVGGASKYAMDFLPFADKVDTLTEATLIYTFL